MAKAILIMDMPSSCEKCNLQCFGICLAVRKSIVGTPTDLKSRPTWCPLREVPQKKRYEEVPLTSPLRAWGNGWNACIDEILGGGE